jgi:hypothetical protein
MVPPVSKDGFFYGSIGFYVEIKKHRHTRSDPGSLYRRLTFVPPKRPVLTKTGKVAKRQPPPHKDSPGHFYIAQLKHYGLEEVDSKPEAKKRLLAAFDPLTKTLRVPDHILAIERELEDEYERAINREAEERMKRNEEEEREQRAEEDAVSEEFAKSTGVTISKDCINEGEDELCKRIEALSDAQLREVMKNLVVMGSWVVMQSIRQELKLIESKVPKRSEKVVSLSSVLNLSSIEGLTLSCQKLLKDTHDDEGEYEILAPYLREQWRDDTQDMRLKISRCTGESQLWAWFHFGVISGVMCSLGPLPEKVGDTARFLWRGREEGDSDQIMTGDDNTACITFLGDGKIKGRMWWMDEWEFVGTKVEPRKKAALWKSVSDWKGEWWGLEG